ncbi:hypothetical protein F4778DRAFT_277906 [Xylariomycetidae sp. FL2044]|nr:hypothetical protein F4778DRAFT_277906 [Xylariomycetidae sp. FL2044]
MADMSSHHILSLPGEIRENIYRMILNPDANRLIREDEYNTYDYRDALVLFRINRQIYFEARKIFRDLNIFVRIGTPWPEACEHVRAAGHVPILMPDNRAAKFNDDTLRVAIEPRDRTMMIHHHLEMFWFVILQDDLEKFTKIWLYDDLSQPLLNSFLTLKLELRDPYTPEWDEKRMPKWLQRRLLLPFGMVKGLRHIEVTGDPKPMPSVESEMRAEQKIPHKSPEQCLADTTHWKEEGNKQLQAGDYTAALDTYRKAWEAMHIVVKGQQRHIHAEAYFARTLEAAPFEGKNGQAERLSLRVQLVANTCLAYTKLEDWENVRFWGMRTIGAIRQAVGMIDDDNDVPPEQEAVTGFPAAIQMGKIYYRTALAYKNLDDKAKARKLLRVASIYLPGDASIQKEIAACALRLG